MDALANLGIDGFSVLLYVVNFGILLFLLERFAYRPLKKHVEERQRRIKEDVDAASEMREALEGERKQEEQKRRERMDELDERIKEAKTAARSEVKTVLTEAEAQREAILAQAAEAADQTIANTVEGAEKEVLDRINRVVSHVLGEGVPKEMVESSVKNSWDVIKKNA